MNAQGPVRSSASRCSAQPYPDYRPYRRTALRVVPTRAGQPTGSRCRNMSTTGTTMFHYETWHAATVTSPLVLLDAASLYFRSFHALPESLAAPDGTPVNAVRGFADTVARVITDRTPSRLVACLDADWRPQFRVDLL